MNHFEMNTENKMEKQEEPRKIVENPRSRKPYHKPEVEIVSLRPKELMDLSCRSASDPAGYNNNCAELPGECVI
jgi:hypothetical protein